MKKINKKGVSLAELLAVVVIMGIIAAIAVPLVGQLIEDTRKDAVLGDARTIATSAQTYCMVNTDAALCKTAGTVVDLTADDTDAPGFNEYLSKTFTGTATVTANGTGDYSVNLIAGSYELNGNPLASEVATEPTGANLYTSYSLVG